MAARKLSPEEKTYINRIELGLSPGRSMVTVSESGLYKLIMRSDKPEAREFQDWVTRGNFLKGSLRSIHFGFLHQN